MKNLTPRQADILYWCSVGKTQWQTAQILGLSLNTIEAHHERIKQKLDTSNIAHSVAVAFRRGELK